MLLPSSGLFLFGWEDRVIEFGTKIYGVTFQRTMVIFFVIVSGLSHSSRHFIWRFVSSFTRHILKEPNIDFEQWWGVMHETR
jgi:hypothetical protein